MTQSASKPPPPPAETKPESKRPFVLSDQPALVHKQTKWDRVSKTFVELPPLVLTRLDHGAEFRQAREGDKWEAPSTAKELQASPSLVNYLKRQVPQMVRQPQKKEG